MSGTLLTLRDVSLGYDGRVVLEHLSLAVEDGECLALVGPNGAGKTTLLRGILGLIPVLAGQIEYGFRSEEHTSELQLLRHLVCRLLLEKKNNRLVRKRT